MTSLTNRHRDEIRRRALADKYVPLFNDLTERENNLALEVREHFYGKHIWSAEAFNANHPGWLRRSPTISVNVGWAMDLHFATAQLMPLDDNHYMNRYRPIEDASLRDKVRDLANAKKDLTDQRNSDELTVANMLDGFNTLKQLRKGWPEGKEYWEPVIGTDDTKPLLPAVQTSAVNAVLGLPKETV